MVGDQVMGIAALHPSYGLDLFRRHHLPCAPLPDQGAQRRWFDRLVEHGDAFLARHFDW